MSSCADPRPQGTPRPAIRSDGLRRQFGDFVAVHGASFEVAEGENFALLGPNGAGKSTLIRMLTTLLQPTSGTATVAGNDVRQDPNAVRRAIGVVPQASTSDPKLTAKENLEFSAKLHGLRPGRAVDELLEWVGLSRWRDVMVGSFSIGMRRRVEIARSLVHEPRILFLDEPTTGLDPASRRAMWEMLATLKSQRPLTMFLTTHYLEEAEQSCDRIAIFDHGKLVALDGPADLIARLPDRESIDVCFGPTPADWKEVVAGLPGVDHVEGPATVWRILSRKRQDTLAALLLAVRERQVSIASLSLRGNSLEDVFLHYTGRDLRDAMGAITIDRRLLH